MDTKVMLKLEEERHQEVLQAIATLERHFGREHAPTNGAVAPRKTKRKQRGGSLRERVLALVTNEFASVNELVKATGLTQKQVRGVLYAPVIKHQFDKRSVGGEVKYKWRGGD